MLDGVRVFDARTIHRATNETSYLELDLNMGVPIRYGVGLMLGSKYLGPFGPRTKAAYGHLGLTNVFGWADPERDLAVGIMTSGKPMVSRHLIALWRVLSTISRQFHPR